MTSPALLRTVPSYLTMMSSMALTNRRWMYPVSEVFTAVQGLTLVHVRAQFEQLQDTFMSYSWVVKWTAQLKLS